MSTLGVDLGTAFARAAVVTERGPKLLQLSDGSHAMPAVVAYHKGTVTVGRAAVAKAAMRPETTVRGVKRLLGRAAGDPLVAAIARYATYGIQPREPLGMGIVVEGEARDPEDVAAAILSHLAAAAKEATGEAPTAAVLTIPYYFGARQRASLAEAARRAGLEAKQIISEGTAIALSLAAVDAAQRRIAIADVGAGGVTVSLVEVGPERVVLLATAGDPAGGGDDLDRGLLGAVIKGLKAAVGDFPDQPAIHEMVRQTCEQMKRDLGVMESVRAQIPFLPIGARGLRGEEVTVDRARFDPLLADTVSRVEVACRAALGQAGIAPSDLAAVYAIGGVANLPAVRGAIERVFGPIRGPGLDPNGAVALGAALQAGMLSGAGDAIPVVDVQSRTLPPPAMPRSMPALDMRGTGVLTSRPPPPLKTTPPPPPQTIPPPAARSVYPPPLQTIPPPAGVGARGTRPPPPRSTPPEPGLDADAFRLEVASLLASVRAGAVTGAVRPSHKVVRVNEAIEADDLVDPEARAEVARRLGGVWKQLGMAMQAMRQYRWDHPQTTRHLQAALREIDAALAVTPRSVRFDVGSAYFSFDRTPVFRPDRPPLDRLPHQLFADGLRRVQLKPGLELSELRDFLTVLVSAATGLGADGDAVSALWEKRFTRIAHLAVDAFAEVDDPVFEAERDELARELAAMCELDADLEASLQSFFAGQREAIDQATAISIPEEARRDLAAGAALSADAYAARLATAFPDAYFEADRHGDLPALTAAFDAFGAERVAAGDPEGLFATVTSLTSAFPARVGAAAAVIERQLLQAVLPRSRVEELFQRLAGVPVTSATAEALGRTLDAWGDPEIYATAEAGYWSGPAELRDALLPYLLRAGAGREAGIGKVVREGSVEHARAALLWLAGQVTAAAREALHQAFQSPHVEVRVAAITHLPEASAETVRAELTKLFDDPAPEVRQKALAVVGSLHAVAAGPVLVRRIQSGALDALPLSERRLLLRTLADLNWRRAEDIAVELLAKTQLVPTPSAEETRVAAAEVLGEMSSEEALVALEAASKRRWWNTAPVRAAAEQAAAAVTARRGGTKDAR